VVTLRALRAADYSVLLQFGGPMFLPRRYRSFHVIAIPLGDDYAIARGLGDRRWWTGRLSSRDVSLHAAGPGERIEWREGATCLYIHLRPAFVARCAGAVGPAAIETHHRLRDPVIREIGAALLAMTVTGAERSAQAPMIALGGHLARAFGLPSPLPVMLGRRTLDDVLDDLRDGDARAASVGELARSCGLSRSYFTRRFRAVTRGSPHSLLTSGRVERAKHLLATGGRSISEAAYETGFVDQSHLSQTFQRLVGVTPRQYRDLHARATLSAQGTKLQERG
jgi:AraC-like DNA-binding protein